MPLAPQQVRRLKARLKPQHVRTRETEGRTIAYLEGWHVIAEANRIFGFDGWDRELIESACVYTKQQGDRFNAAYTARIRIKVRAGEHMVTREGSGAGEASASSPGQAHELAMKAAETDATKRALMTFGNPFGLSLYGPAKEMAPAHASMDAARPAARDPNGRFNGHRHEADAAPSMHGHGEGNDAPARRAEAVEASNAMVPAREEQGVQTATALHHGADGASGKTSPDTFANPTAAPSGAADPDTVNGKPIGVGGNASPARAYAVRSSTVSAKAQAPSGNHPVVAGEDGSDKPPSIPASAQQTAPVTAAAEVSTERPRIDKSALALAEPRRIRDQAHLRFVASRPCLICGRNKAQAHHLRFAQPRAIGRKVSDEYTVPLCSMHHRLLHQTGNEIAWWEYQQIDPLPVAAELWRQSRAVQQSREPPPSKPEHDADQPLSTLRQLAVSGLRLQSGTPAPSVPHPRCLREKSDAQTPQEAAADRSSAA